MKLITKVITLIFLQKKLPKILRKKATSIYFKSLLLGHSALCSPQFCYITNDTYSEPAILSVRLLFANLYLSEIDNARGSHLSTVQILSGFGIFLNSYPTKLNTCHDRIEVSILTMRVSISQPFLRILDPSFRVPLASRSCSCSRTPRLPIPGLRRQ